MKRSKAPNAKVKTAANVYTRDDLVAQLDKEHPEFVHSFRSNQVSNRTLTRAEQEVVKVGTYGELESAEPLVYREDIVVRRPRKDYEEDRAAKTEESAERVKSIYLEKPDYQVDDHELDGGDEWRENGPGKRVAKPKDPREINNNGGM